MSSDDRVTSAEAAVLERITEARWLALATELIRTGQPRSGNPLDPDQPGGEEEAIAMLVAGKLAAMGMEVETIERTRSRPNVVGRLAGAAPGPSLMINDHLDTYPVAEPEKWTMTNGDPFSATRHGDRLYARGTSDTRGNLAAALLAMEAVLESGAPLTGELLGCFTVDEERNGADGSIYLMQEVGLRVDYSITAEPTAWGPVDGEWGLNLSLANSGHCLVEVIIEGEKAHIWRPDLTTNAIVEAGKLLPQLEKMAFEHAPQEFMGHTPPCCSIVRIRGGLEGEMQFSPDRCVITIAVVGIVEGMTMEGVLADVNRVIAEATGGQNSISASARQVPGSMFVAATPPSPVEEEPCLSLRSAYRALKGGEPQVNRKNAFNDTIRFREAGINAVTFGPGEDGWAADNEWISITKSVEAAKIYALAIMRILGEDV